MKANKIRQTFIEFFISKGHKHVPSSPVLPQDDPTILFTNAGMNQFKDIFCGRESRDYKRAVTAQKCIRAGGKHNDLDNVGRTARHLTFFEMLGNFSFGDYFKEKAITWGWELLTGPFGLSPRDLYITVYHDDDEARALWHNHIGVPKERIFGLGDKDNFWSMGNTGPCGPCSEIHFDRGDQFACGPECGIGRCDCDRWFEVWNLVFMQFDQAEDGSRKPLPKPSIDTGMGLERLAMVLQGVQSVYETDLMSTIIQEVASMSGCKYSMGADGVPHRVVADHIRSLAFALADGAYPANEGRGYVVRRILRRASRYGRMIGLKEPFLHRLVDIVIKCLGHSYPELESRHDTIATLILSEEERFGQTMEQGLVLFEETRKALTAAQETTIPGDKVFLMHDTYGFPTDLVCRMAEESGLTVDMAGYDKLMAAQKAQSRAGAKFESQLAPGLDLSGLNPTQFLGYRDLSVDTKLLAWSLDDDNAISMVLEETPFYAEAGGQVGDTGTIEGEAFTVTVKQTVKLGEHILHVGTFSGDKSALKTGVNVLAETEADKRGSIQRHHTATHLLHSALRETLGAHVEQRGSLVDTGRLRFDFTHHAALAAETIQAVESWVNRAITANSPVITEEVTMEEAREKGAMALFGEKYGDQVRMVDIPDFSTELCGGTHVNQTGDIGVFKVVSESSVAAGIRRVEAVAGPDALKLWHDMENRMAECAQALKTTPALLLQRIQGLKKDMKALQQKKQQAPPAAELSGGQRAFGDVTAQWKILSGCGMNDLRTHWDRLKDGLSQTVLILLGRDGESCGLLACLSPDLKGKTDIHCGQLARTGGKVMGAGGGGRPDMGQAGGKAPDKLDDALAAVLAEIEKQTSPN